jgi:xylulokinase
MAPGPKTGPPLFLGLELATDQLRASIVDESLELVGVDCVDFDSELPEYQWVSLFSSSTAHTVPVHSSGAFISSLAPKKPYIM